MSFYPAKYATKSAAFISAQCTTQSTTDDAAVNATYRTTNQETYRTANKTTDEAANIKAIERSHWPAYFTAN